jgi:hypothetical protein
MFGAAKKSKCVCIKNLLVLFCKTTGMVINNRKSMFLKHNLEQAFMEEILNILPYDT